MQFLAPAPAVHRVSVRRKSPSHPWFGLGWPGAYTIDGEEGKLLILLRDQMYLFNVDTPGHPFYFTTSDTGGRGARASSRETTFGDAPTELGRFTLTVSDPVPSSFFYQCAIHGRMGGRATASAGPHVRAPASLEARARCRIGRSIDPLGGHGIFEARDGTAFVNLMGTSEPYCGHVFDSPDNLANRIVASGQRCPECELVQCATPRMETLC